MQSNILSEEEDNMETMNPDLILEILNGMRDIINSPFGITITGIFAAASAITIFTRICYK